MNKLITQTLALCVVCSACATSKPADVKLVFDADNYTELTITVPTKGDVRYKAYEHLYYVTNVEDSTYQYLNIFVPEGATQKTPIFMPNSVGGYMAAAPGHPNAGSASGRALAEGYVVVMPGARGRNSVVTNENGETLNTGRAPKGLLDLKAAVRYLRYFDKEIPGDSERIISDGTSAGGAMSSLLGATGNHPDYEPLLEAMGAAPTRDDVYASVCFCPIIDLDHADMSYEWLYGVTNNVTRPISEAAAAVSGELAAQYPAYLESLNLRTPEGELLTADNYRDYLKKLLIEAAQMAKDAGADIPDSVGFVFSNLRGFSAPVNGGPVRGQRAQAGPRGERPQGAPQGGPHGEGPQGERPQGAPQGGPQGERPQGGRPMMQMGGGMPGEYIIDLDLDTYLNYVVTTHPLKGAPSFDSQGVAGGRASGENDEFGDEHGSTVNFTDYSLQKATGDPSATVSDEIRWNVRLLNPMYYIGDAQATTAQYWYIRHGARDRDTAFTVPVNLALKLQNNGKDVDFRLPWNRPHSGDYALNEMFEWIKKITE